MVLHAICTTSIFAAEIPSGGYLVQFEDGGNDFGYCTVLKNTMRDAMAKTRKSRDDAKSVLDFDALLQPRFRRRLHGSAADARGLMQILPGTGAQVAARLGIPWRGGESLFEDNGIFFALWPRTGGREPEELSEIDLQILGRLLARVHNMGAARGYKSRPRFSSDRFVHEPLALLREKKFLRDDFAEQYTVLADRIAAHFNQHRDELPLLRIHGDLHKGNILNGSDGWFLLDFDDSLTGPAVQDVWMLFPGDRHSGDHARATFLAAYREFREFDESWLALAETLRAMRIIHYSGWIARRFEDPSFQQAFPTFASDAYWEEEIGILSDICDGLGDGTVSGQPGEKLSNKDFFFDMED